MDTKTRAFLRSCYKNALHASVRWPTALCTPAIKEEIAKQLACSLMSSETVQEKIQESIVTQENVADKTTFNSSLYVFTEDELYKILYDFASTKPAFPKPQTINESLI